MIERPEAVENDGAIDVIGTGRLGPGWGLPRFAQLATADDVGLEFFEFPGDLAPEAKLEPKRRGAFHFAAVVLRKCWEGFIIMRIQ